MKKELAFPLSVAPMMDYSDRHFRMLMRFITKKTLLYTEMISVGAILHGNRDRHLDFSKEEHPLILQVGGDSPSELAECCHIAAEYGYDEINLNCGCPSDKVQRGNFGAALMANPGRTATLIRAMVKTQSLPVSVKCRIGIDGSKLNLPTLCDYTALTHFAHEILAEGASRVTVHARIAILGGLSPKENRNVPPLQYPLVYKLQEDFPNAHIELNGGIRSQDELGAQLSKVSGVMIGRAAVDNPSLFAGIDSRIESDKTSLVYSSKHTESDTNTHTSTTLQDFNPIRIMYNYAKYLEEAQEKNIRIHHALRHVIPFFNGMQGAKRWRFALSTLLQKNETPTKAIDHALEYSGLV